MEPPSKTINSNQSNQSHQRTRIELARRSRPGRVRRSQPEAPPATADRSGKAAPLLILAGIAILVALIGLTLNTLPAANAQETLNPAASPTPATSPSSGGALLPGGLGNILLVLVLTLLNGAFSMAETALVTLRRTRVDQLVEEGRRGALTVRRLVENPPRFIATTQFGITLLGFASAAAAATKLADPLVPLVARIPGVGPGTATTIAVAVVTVLVALVTMILGEIAPKSLAAQAPDVWALRLAPFINLCATLFSPITVFVVSISNLIVRPFGAKAQFETPMITREEFEKIIEGGEKHGEIDDEEADIITNVLDLSETPVRAVMTPRIDMTALPVDAPLARLLDTILTSGHSRIPVFEGTIDSVVGIVHAKDVLPLFLQNRTDVDLREVTRPAYYVPETKRVSDLLKEFRRSKQQLAIVQDEYTGTEGLVTLEDLLEEIVGDIKDEYDVDEPDVHVLSPTESLIDGRMSIDDVNDRLGIALPHEEVNTVGGLIYSLLGREPVVGDRVRQDNIEFVVERMDGQRIHSVRAIQLPDHDPEDGDTGEETPRSVPTLVP